jgi:protein TonB
LLDDTFNLTCVPAKTLMSDNYIEKIFLYFVVLSLLLHLIAFGIIVLFPEKKGTPRPEPYMVELQDLPAAKGEPPRRQIEVKRLDEQRRRFEREIAPRGERERDRFAPPPPQRPQAAEAGRTPSRQAGRDEISSREKAGAGDFFKRQEKGTPDLSRLFPSADKLARLEESYRKKYGPEVAEGGATFLNTDDITLGSFLRRFESAIYGVWRYPPEAARMGIEGVTPVKITFNRKGEIEKVKLLESSGSKILDDEVMRTLKAVGTIGSLPRSYDKETFDLIAFFHYGIERGVIRGTLR